MQTRFECSRLVTAVNVNFKNVGKKMIGIIYTCDCHIYSTQYYVIAWIVHTATPMQIKLHTVYTTTVHVLLCAGFVK